MVFIDGVNYLYRQENERDWGQKAIEILHQVMENQRDLFRNESIEIYSVLGISLLRMKRLS